VRTLNQTYKVIGLDECLNAFSTTPARNFMLQSTMIQQEMEPALLEFDYLSDINLMVKNTLADSSAPKEKLFRLHKAILGSRSAWFEALCVKQNFKETSISIITIDTITLEVFEVIIEYIYTGRLRELPPSVAIEVLIEANKLGLTRLHQICQRDIDGYLNEENVVAIALAAEYHLATSLLQDCINIIAELYDSVSTSKEYTMLSTETKQKCSNTHKEYVSRIEKSQKLEILAKDIPCFFYKKA